MTNFISALSMMREQMQADLSRSDVLRVLIWPILITFVAFISAMTAKAPIWVLIVLIITTLVFLSLYAASFVFLLFNDRDALRSEKYSLHKMAIEHGLYGDSATGLIEVSRANSTASDTTIISSSAAPEGADD